MMILATADNQFDWIRLKAIVRAVAPYAVVFGLGGWSHSIVEQDFQLSYWKSSTNQLEQVKAVAGNNPVATLKCLRKSNTVAKNVAGQAVVALQDARIAAPSLQQIPSCPTPAKPYSAVSSKK